MANKVIKGKHLTEPFLNLLKMIPRIFLIILGMLGAIGTMAAELTDAERAIVKKSVKAELKDPDSARFKWLPIAGSKKKVGGARSMLYCGVVNSRNSFGGYAGDAPYSVFLAWTKDSPVVSLVISIGTADWKSPESFSIIKTCSDEGYTNFLLAK